MNKICKTPCKTVFPFTTAEFGFLQWNQMAGELGFEPRLTESESAVLPLNYSPTNSLKSNKNFCRFTIRRRKFYKFRPDCPCI